MCFGVLHELQTYDPKSPDRSNAATTLTTRLSCWVCTSVFCHVFAIMSLKIWSFYPVCFRSISWKWIEMICCSPSPNRKSSASLWVVCLPFPYGRFIATRVAMRWRPPKGWRLPWIWETSGGHGVWLGNCSFSHTHTHLGACRWGYCG